MEGVLNKSAFDVTFCLKMEALLDSSMLVKCQTSHKVQTPLNMSELAAILIIEWSEICVSEIRKERFSDWTCK